MTFYSDKSSIHEEYIIIINIHTNNNSTKIHNQKLTDIQEKNRIIFIEDLNIPISTMDRTT